ncbi:MAG: MBL fold metallo-hydrolase [Ruminococcus sp.]|nr:MBL fold metallo-hydrolase [Ruminococcus sp.]
MKKRFIALFLLIICVIPISACSTSSPDTSFEITFIDVGQGDSALVECEGEYMLIDVGTNTKSSSEKIRGLLQEKGINELKYLVVSHWHEDHYGGLRQTPNALQNITAIDYLLCNKDPYEKNNLSNILPIISERINKIIVPNVKDSYTLGGASIDVIEVCADQENDSLVLLVTYGKTRFLFTGDAVGKTQSKIADTLRGMSKILKTGENLIKMPHHGGYNIDLALPSGASDNSLATLVNESYAKYFVISVGAGNSYGHPHKETLEIIDQVLDVNNLDKESHLFRTDECGNVSFTSNGKKIIPIQ